MNTGLEMIAAVIGLIVADIDGCLLRGKGFLADTPTLAKLQRYCQDAAKTRKPPLVLCTGRPAPYVEVVVQILGAFFGNCPSVVENGCFLFDPVKDVLIPNPAILGKEKELREVKRLIESKQVGQIEPGKEICVSINPYPGMTIVELFEAVKLILTPDFRRLIFVTHSNSAVDITPIGVNKASGLRFLAESTGISPNAMLGIGDSSGDLPALELVGWPSCPGNASKAVKDLVRTRKGYVATESDTAGVIEILHYYNLM